jgi:hypothetical protein
MDLFGVEPEAIEDRATPHAINADNADYSDLFGVMQEPEPESKEPQTRRKKR